MNPIKKIYLSVRRIGVRKSLDILVNTIQRELSDLPYRGYGEDNCSLVDPGRLIQAEAFASGHVFCYENAKLEVLFLADDLIRLTWGPGIIPPPYAIARTDWNEVTHDTCSSGDRWQLSSETMSVTINNEGAIEFTNRNGDLLRRERPPLQVIRNSKRKSKSESGWIHHIPLAADTAVFGLGEKASRLNLMGKSFRMWNRDPEGLYNPGDDPLYLCIPAYLALHSGGSYLIFYENPFLASFSFGNKESTDGKNPPTLDLANEDDESERIAVTRFEGGALRYYFIAGQPRDVLERFSELTGKPCLPPRWALGYHQSRWGYKNQEDIQAVVAGFIRNKLPISAIHLDIDYMEGYKVFTVDRERFPDLAGLVEQLSDSGIHTVPILDPGVKTDPSYPVYLEGKEQGYFCKTPTGKIQNGIVWPGWAAFPDFSNPRARQWWGEKYKDLLDQGVAGFWHDMNEPASFAAWGEMTLPKATRHDLDGMGGDHRQAHNLYGLLMNRAGYEALSEFRPDHRPWLLTRSGWAGIARYAWTWTADTGASWEALKQVIPTVLGLTLSGVPYSGSDIGGFSGSPDPELYLRWFQMSAFMPFFRTHSSIESPPREPWTFGEKTLNILRDYLLLRYQLIPYLYTLAWNTSQTGCPLVRPIFWDEPDDQSLWSIDHEFMLGESLLIAPVMDPGTSTRKVTLPRGEWYDFWEDARYEGPGNIILPVTLERIPLFVRAGTILTLEKEDSLELDIYPISDGERQAQLYSDFGDGYGDYRVDTFRMQGSKDEILITWEEVGEYPFPYKSIRVRLAHRDPLECLVDGAPVPIRGRNVEINRFQQLRIRYAVIRDYN